MQSSAPKAAARKSVPKKKKTPEKTRNGAGPKPVAPPPASGPWGAPKSAPPPGFAPAPARTGFSDAHKRLLRHRALFAFRFLVGKAVELTLAQSQERYAGVLDCVDPDDFSVVLKSARRLTDGDKPFEDGSTVIFKRQQLAHLVADGTVNYSEGVFGAGSAGGFRTDTEISGRQGEHLYGRELEAASSWLDPALDTGALEDGNGRRRNQGKNGAWNQFEANEKLFGVVSTYDENIYTTKLDKSKISTEQSRAAEKMAQEIERQSAAGNFHLQEERGQTRGNKFANDLDEEARYSSVDRRGANTGSGSAYVPPALRNTQRQSSGGKPQSKAPKEPTPVVEPAATAPPAPTPASAPAPAAAKEPTPTASPVVASSAPHKPLSFSEAVTGRAAPAAPAAPVPQTPAPAPKTEEKKGGSPKKTASPKKVNGKDAKPDATSNSKAKPASPAKKEPKSSKDRKGDSKPVESKTEAKSSATTTESAESKNEAKAAPAKKGLNPNAKEFKLSASAAEFTPSFAVPAVAKSNTSSPYRGGSPGPVPYPGMGYPPMQEEWMYEGGEDGAEMGMPPYMQGGYMPMMYPPMMPQQPMMRGHRGYGGYHQQGYNPRGYYPPNGGYPGGVPYNAAGMPGGPQPPLPREPTPNGDESPGSPPADADGQPAPPVPETAPEVDSVSSNSKEQTPAAPKDK